ncbi:flagellar filament capping protein FliD [Tepidiphilus margaritifer]|uniref:flagellar filament capping protein FliD n=1 Tax=Tepidiphilus margaritifer TaxID=203471 RepID=UPI00040F668F|nr:flagellar filament capping protein FliD [Tepidiphilus margaritifer]
MATTIPSSGTITSTGLGSGLDINGIIDKLMQVEQKPIDAINQKISDVQTKISAFGQVKSALSTLQSAAKSLSDPNTLYAVTTSVGSGAGFTATAGAGAATGTYDIGVQQLAQAQRVATSATSTFTPGAGTLTISAGGQSVQIDFSAGGTLEDLRNAINDQANSLVSATLVDNGTAKQLVITSRQTGTNQAFSLTGTDGLSGLTFDPNATNPPTDPSSDIYQVQAAQDAKITFNGLTVTRFSNTIDDLIPGVTLTLQSVTSSTAPLNVQRDNSALEKAMQSFVDAYNAVNNTIYTLTYYDPSTKTAGPLSGDSALRTIQNQLRNTLNSLTGSGTLRSYTDLGLTFDDKGKLSFDTATFDKALQTQPSAVKQMLVGTDTQPGLATRLDSLLTIDLQTGGLLDASVQGLNSKVTLLNSQKERLQSQLDRIQATYQQQFNNMDTIVGQYNSLSTYLTQQFNALFASSKSG